MRSFTLPNTPPDRLARWRAAFARVGWFVPAFVSVGLLDLFAAKIEREGDNFGQETLQRLLTDIYSPTRLAAMALHRYPATHIIRDYSVTIVEAVQAHLIGLHHLAIGGLVPVIEGAGKRFAEERGLATGPRSNAAKVFKLLMDDYKRDAIERNIGATDEMTAMVESFSDFAEQHLYVDTTLYLLSDKTNRHGITHGLYADADYGTPLNFYKAMSAIDMLTFTSIIRHGGSVFVPERSAEVDKFLNCTWAQAELRKKLIAPS